MKGVPPAASFLVLTLISISLCFAPVFGARESVQVTRLAQPVTVDGKWTTPDEWSDTNRVSMYLVQGPESTAYIRLKHDPNMTQAWLYLLVDFISDATSAAKQGTGGTAYDGLKIGGDQNTNDNNTECCDRYFELTWNNGKNAPEPMSPPVRGAMSYNATNDPDSKNSHAIYELAIPMSSPRQVHTPMTVRTSVWDWSRGVNMHWPKWQPVSGSWNMAYFGDLVFSDVVVPEFPLDATALLAAVVLGTLIITRRKKEA